MCSNAAFKIKFEGQNHQIDANTLINALVHYSCIIQTANKVYGNGTKDVSVQINALEKGSFIIDLSIAAKSALSNLFSSDNISYLSGLITILGGVFGGYKALKGRPAKTDDEKNIITNIVHNETIKNTVINVYNQPLVRDAISKTFKTIDDDVCVEGMSLITGENDRVDFTRDEFSDMIYDDFDKESEMPGQRVVIDKDAKLVIMKLSFEKGATWTFNYKGFKINVPVKDNVLMKLIDNGERFGKGDSIRVTLAIAQQYNPEYKVYENKTFRIEEFHEHIVAPSEQQLFN